MFPSLKQQTRRVSWRAPLTFSSVVPQPWNNSAGSSRVPPDSRTNCKVPPPLQSLANGLFQDSCLCWVGGSQVFICSKKGDSIEFRRTGLRKLCLLQSPSD